MRVTASQKLSRDSGESIFAARHQDVSQGSFQKGPFARDSRVVIFFSFRNPSQRLHPDPTQHSETDRNGPKALDGETDPKRTKSSRNGGGGGVGIGGGL